jgi:HEAT repeat protein
MQGWMLELLGEARDVRALHAFMQLLLSQDASVRQWTESGLRKLGQTREGRKTLWATLQPQEAVLTAANKHDELQVREALARVLDAPRHSP